jgi:DNA-binding MarR family transcriptional regulator
MDEVVGQIGLFFRRAQTLFQLVRPSDDAVERSSYILLGIIASEGPIRLTTLAMIAQLNLSTISRQVAVLEGMALIARESDPADGRASLVRVTESGQTILDRSRERWLTELTKMLAHWNEADRTEFARLFIRLNEAMAVRCAGEDN